MRLNIYPSHCAGVFFLNQGRRIHDHLGGEGIAIRAQEVILVTVGGLGWKKRLQWVTFTTIPIFD